MKKKYIQQNNSLLIGNKQNKQSTEMNSFNKLSNAILIKETENYNNKASKNSIEINNNINIINNNLIYKIKYILDISKIGLSGEDKKVHKDNIFI